MRLEAGSRLARYRILDFLDAGGMGDVYRARDPRLGREVAIKVLTARFDGDERARARFEREARAVASLSHPNILSIHELGREADMLFAVTELLEGETLRRRLERGPLPARRALQIGAAIAEGLAAAHARGVVHRDLKPENVFLVEDDRVKILDFGVASLRASDDGGANADDVRPGSGDGDQVTARVEMLAASRPGVASDTLPGEIVGTAGYLSPEQARSEPVDGRSDVFALGCVLYEMIAGRPAFVRATPVETLVALLREEPPPFPDGAPSELCAVIRQCLRKDPVKRFQSAHDLALCLRLLDPDRPASSPPPVAPAAGAETQSSRSGRAAPPAVRPPGRASVVWALAAALLLGALAGWLLKPVDPRPAPVLEPLTYTGRDREPAASYDGKRLAFASDRDGVSRIWLKQLAGGDETPLTEGPDRAPRFSPDDSTILFTRAEGLASSLYRVPAVGGPARKLIDGAIAGDFSPDGREVVIVRWRAGEGGEVDSVISLAAADGGGERVIATLDGRRVSQPRFAPDGRTVALAEAESPTPALVLLDPATGASRDLRPPGAPAFLSAAAFSGRDGALTYAITETLIPRHGGRSRVVRQQPGGGGVETLLWYSSTVRAVERLGDEALVLEFETPSMDLVETARRGDGSAHFFTRGPSTDRQPIYSPDGGWILFSSNRSGNLDLWAVATDGGSLRRLTDDPAEDWDPAFMPDGRLLWSSRRSGAFEIWLAEADGTAPRQVTRDGVLAENPTATPDGAWIVYNSRNPEAPGVWKVRPDGGEPTLLVRGVTRLPAAAPDGEHLLYLTDIRPSGLSLRLARLDGTVLDDGVALPAAGGRARWLPEGDAIAYTVPHADGRVGIEVLPFPLPPPEARAPRPLLVLGAETSVDSFALSPDGARVCYARQQVLSGLVLAAGLAR